MLVIQRDEYEKILSDMDLSLESKEKCIDVYHKNDWDRFTMYYSGEKKNECPWLNSDKELIYLSTVS